MSRGIRIGDIDIGARHPCRFVAELSNSHNGSIARALKLIDAAKHAGADLVKFQAYTADELVALRGDGPAPAPWGAQGYTMRTLYERAATPLAWLPTLFQQAKVSGIPAFSSVFGLASLAALEAAGCPAYKVSHFEAGQGWLFDALRATGKPIISSHDRFPDEPCGDVTLYCPGGYPCAPADVDLDTLDYFDGLSSHCLAPELPVAAVSRGCAMIEMHFMLEAEPSALEANVSLNERQFAAMVRAVRRTEEMLGYDLAA